MLVFCACNCGSLNCSVDFQAMQRLGVTWLDDTEEEDWYKVTHLLVDDKTPTKRSVKVMFAMCRTSFIVTTAWVRKCIENEEIVPLESRVDPRVPKHKDLHKRVTSESLDRAMALRSDGKYVLSDCAISVCRHVTGVRGSRLPSIHDIERLVVGAGGEWLKECVPESPSERLHTIVITSDAPDQSQKKALKRKHPSVLTKTAGWLFDTLMSQQLDLSK